MASTATIVDADAQKAIDAEVYIVAAGVVEVASWFLQMSCCMVSLASDEAERGPCRTPVTLAALAALAAS